eukprot:4177651-Amphidinium_carterae.1
MIAGVNRQRKVLPMVVLTAGGKVHVYCWRLYRPTLFRNCFGSWMGSVTQNDVGFVILWVAVCVYKAVTWFIKPKGVSALIRKSTRQYLVSIAVTSLLIEGPCSVS